MSCTLLRTTAASENIVCGPQTIILNWTPILTPETFDLTDIHVMCLSGVYTLLYAFCAPGAPPHPPCWVLCLLASTSNDLRSR